ncbi:hypothetical protein B0J18DRAFT_117282 [Chaetomium sp. MPI-SDFR-AT-0129]|nr:hypothetical protein B0J18DRAFT_117282 [Chaetomium sp. MPI-SDFR-AT-0129]
MESFQLLRRRTTELFSSLEQSIPAMPAIPSMPAMPSLPSVPSLGGGGNKSNNANTMKATWEKLDIPHLPRSAHSADVVAGTVYLFGGEITPGRVVADNDVHAVKLPSSGAPADYYAIKAKPAKKPVVIPTVVEPTPETEEEELSEIPLGGPGTATATTATTSTPATPRAPRPDLPDVPPPRAGHATAVIGHRIFLFGGHTNGTNGGSTVPLDEGGRVWVFDTRTHLWSFLDPQSPTAAVEEIHPSPRSHHAAVATAKPDSFDSITSPTSPKFRSRPHASSRAEAWRDWALGTSAEAEQTYGTPNRPVVGVLAEKATDADADGYGTFIIHGGVLAPAAAVGVGKPAAGKKVEDDEDDEEEEDDSEEDEDDDEDDDDDEEDDSEEDDDEDDEDDSDDSDEDEESEDEAPKKNNNNNKGKAKAEPKPTPVSTSASSKPASAPAPAPVQTTAETWAFDVRSRVWQRLPDAPAPARAGVSLAIGRGKGGRLYRFGGFTGSTPGNSSTASGNLDFLDLGVDVFDDQVTGGRGSEAVLAVRGGGWKTLGVSLGPQAGFGFSTVDEEGGETQGLQQQPGATPGNNTIDWPGARSVAGFQAVSVGGGREYLVLLFGAREPSSPAAAGTTTTNGAQFWDDIWALQVPSEGFSLASVADTAFSVVRTVRSGSLNSRPGTATSVATASTTTNTSYAPSASTAAGSTATSTSTAATTGTIGTNATINAVDLGLTWTRVEAGPHDEEDDESAEGPGARGWVASAAMLEECGWVDLFWISLFVFRLLVFFFHFCLVLSGSPPSLQHKPSSSTPLYSIHP